MTVIENCLTDSPAKRLTQTALELLRQRRQTRSDIVDETAADEPIAAAELAATMPSWPRIFPGL